MAATKTTKSKKVARKQLDEATLAASKVGMDEFIQLLNSPKRLIWLNLYTGIMRGIGGVLGAAFVIVLIGLLVNFLGGLPIIGHFLKNISQATSTR